MAANYRESSEDLKKILEQTHPEYTKYRHRWELYEDCYSGGPDIVRWIHRHLRESLTSVRQRKARAFYPNYCQTIIDAYMSYIFRKGVVRQPEPGEDRGPVLTPSPPSSPDESAFLAPDQEAARVATEPLHKRKKKRSLIAEELEEFWKDVDQCGTPIDRFMAEVGIWMLTYGQYHVIVDMPRTKEEPANEQQRREMKLHPYLVKVSPLCLTNWEYGEDKKLLWIRIREEISEELDSFSERKKGGICQYRTWTRNEWHIHRITGDKVEYRGGGNHPLKEVPLVTFYCGETPPLSPIGNSFLRDIGPINLAILNWGSLIDNEAYERCLNILVMERSQLTPGEIVIGTNNVLEYNMGGTPPHFLTASTEPASFIQNMIREAVQEIYRLSRLGGLTGRVTREARSGVAYKFESNEANQAIASKADRLEAGERRIHELHEKWLGREWEGVIDYPEEFGIESVEEEVALLTQVKGQFRSPTLKRLLEKKAAVKLLGKLPKSTMETVDIETDTLEEVKPTFSPFGM